MFSIGVGFSLGQSLTSAMYLTNFFKINKEGGVKK